MEHSIVCTQWGLLSGTRECGRTLGLNQVAGPQLESLLPPLDKGRETISRVGPGQQGGRDGAGEGQRINVREWEGGH